MELVKDREGNEWEFHNPALTEEIEGRFHEALDAYDEGQDVEAEDLARDVAFECPNHIDALHHIGLFLGERGAVLDSYAFCQAAVSLGLHAIPASFRWDEDRIPWGRLANRPFLRAYHGLGLHRMEQGAWHEAITIFKRLLAINPNDNQGVRLVLPKCWFETNNEAAVIEHCQQHRGEDSPDILYAKALALAILRRTSEAKAAVQECVAARPLVARELLRKRHPRPKSRFPGTITVGGADEAWEYWRACGKYWERSTLAMDLLRKATARR